MQNKGMDIAPKVLVCQRGARHRYTIPQLFEDAQLLVALYTDSSVYSLVGRLAKVLKKFGLNLPRLSALVARNPARIPAGKIFSYDQFLVPNKRVNLNGIFARHGLQKANVIYSTCGEYAQFLCWAKKQGAKLIVDVFVHPGTDRIVENELSSFPEHRGQGMAYVEASENHFRRSFDLADIILCPSSWVADGVREYAPEHTAKIRIVPYGSSLAISPVIDRSVLPGRILFAGREAIRKGVHYLAKAAELVRSRGYDIDVRLAGLTREDVSDIKHHEQLNCLGVVPMDSMKDEFRQADVFVLPSLSEGQAGVILESMACGCPVIATRESGVDFDPECGITVPARDAEALAEAIIQVVADRDYRHVLAEGALRQAEQFSTAAWKKRLVGVATEAVNL